MRLFDQATLAIDEGHVALFSEFEDGGSMWTGDGPRERRKTVTFSRSFRAPPIVQAGVTLWDVDNSANFRAHLLTEEIAPDRFTLVLRTWGDTRIARIEARWIAFGTAAVDADWTL